MPLHDLPHSSYSVELFDVVLTNNNFGFNGEHYHQVSGTALVPNWYLHMPTWLCHDLKGNMYAHVTHYKPYGKDSLMTFFLYGLMAWLPPVAH